MRDPQLPGGGLLKRSYLLPKDKLLRLKHMSYRLQQFLVEGLVLAFEVEHRYRLGDLAGSGAEAAGFFHMAILRPCFTSLIQAWAGGLASRARASKPTRKRDYASTDS